MIFCTKDFIPDVDLASEAIKSKALNNDSLKGYLESVVPSPNLSFRNGIDVDIEVLGTETPPAKQLNNTERGLSPKNYRSKIKV